MQYSLTLLIYHTKLHFQSILSGVANRFSRNIFVVNDLVCDKSVFLKEKEKLRYISEIRLIYHYNHIVVTGIYSFTHVFFFFI